MVTNVYNESFLEEKVRAVSVNVLRIAVDVFIKKHNNIKMLTKCPDRSLGILLFSKLAGVLIVGFLTGCIRTDLRGKELSDDFLRLSEVNSRPVSLKVDVPDNINGSVGHQFLFFVIPFGNIYVSNLKEILFRHGFEKLTLSGYSPVRGEPGNGEALAITMTLSSIQVSAFDLFFTRRLSCEVVLSAAVTRGSAVYPTVTRRVTESEFSRYGFRPELERVLSRTLNRAIDELLSAFRM